MFHSVSRILTIRTACVVTATRVLNQKTALVNNIQYDNQIDYIKSLENNSLEDWKGVKTSVLSMRGNINPKNIDAVMLKILVGNKNLTAATSFFQYLKSSNEELSLGTINSILHMYYEMSKSNKLSKEQKQFILDAYGRLYEKYKVLDSSTCEQLLHVLCIINEWEKALKVLEDIHLSSVPSHSAYSTLIATFFRLNKKKKALELIHDSVRHKRPLQDIAYEEWVQYILRKYKDKKAIGKYFNEIFEHIALNWAVITENTANRLRSSYESLNWDAQFSRMRKLDGQCSNCKHTLDCLNLNTEEFNMLQENIKEKLIVGSDLLLKTTHDELKRFLDFVESTAPYDVVLDGLNISYAIGKGSHIDKLHFLDHVVNHFVSENKKVLLLSRKHMLSWNRKLMEKIMCKTSSFFTDNLSQDDPFFITAAILSGPHTDIVSKDLLRGHKFNLKDENLKQLFKRWQWQHQWMVFLDMKQKIKIQQPLKFTPCAQQKNNTWHIPFESQILPSYVKIKDGTPDLRSWLCLTDRKSVV